MPIRNFSAPILDIHNNPVRPGPSAEAMTRAINRVAPEMPADLQAKLAEAINAECGQPLTLADVAVESLMTPYQGEDQLPMTERLQRMKLAQKLVEGGEVDITPDERERIKTLAIKRYAGPLVPCRIEEMLEEGAA